MEKRRLLIVDDVPEMGEFVGTVASEIGYDVEVVTGAVDFMRFFERFNPTTVVIDIVMPDFDGFDLIKWLRERDCDAKVIVASNGNLNYAKLARALGRGRGLDISVIEKPFQMDELRTALV